MFSSSSEGAKRANTYLSMRLPAVSSSSSSQSAQAVELTNKLDRLLAKNILTDDGIHQAMAWVKEGANPNFLLLSLIDLFINNGITFEKIKPLLETLVRTYRANINLLDASKKTPLQSVVEAQRQDFDMTLLLLELDADPAVKVLGWNSFFHYLFHVNENDKSNRAIQLVINNKKIASDINELLISYLHNPDLFFKYLIRMKELGLNPVVVDKKLILDAIKNIMKDHEVYELNADRMPLKSKQDYFQKSKQDYFQKSKQNYLYVRAAYWFDYRISEILFPLEGSISEFVNNKKTMRELKKITAPYFASTREKMNFSLTKVVGDSLDPNQLKFFRWDTVFSCLANGEDVNQVHEIPGTKTRRIHLAQVLVSCVEQRIPLPKNLLEKLFIYGLDLSVLSSDERKKFNVTSLFNAGDYGNAFALIKYGESSDILLEPNRWFGKKITFLDAMLNKFGANLATMEDARFVINILASGVKITVNQKDYPEVFIALLNCLDILPNDFELSPDVLSVLKHFKDELTVALRTLPEEKEFSMLSKVFSDGISSLGQVYLAGRAVDINDSGSSSGAAYARFQELKEKRSRKPEPPINKLIDEIEKIRLKKHDVAVINDFFKTYANQPQIFNEYNRMGDTALIAACISGDAELVSKILAVPGIDVNKRNTIQFSALMMATAGGHRDIVWRLLKAGANLSALNLLGKTALAYAKNNLEIIKCFVEHDKSSITYENEHQSSLLATAVIHNNIEVFLYLLEQEKDFYKNSSEKLALHLEAAVRCRSYGVIVHILLAADAKDMQESTLTRLKKVKKPLFAYIKTLPEAEQIAIFKKIFDKPKENAIGRVFWYIHSNVTTGNLFDMFCHYHNLLKNELKTLKIDELSADDMEKILYFIKSRMQHWDVVPFAKQDADIHNVIYQYGSKKSPGQLSSDEKNYLSFFGFRFNERYGDHQALLLSRPKNPLKDNDDRVLNDYAIPRPGFGIGDDDL